MNLTRVYIENLRCIETLEFFPKKYTSMIGPNNAGKSSALRALELFLNQEPPDLDEWRKGFEDKPIIIEAEFDSLQDWERKAPGVAAHVFDNKIRIRMSATRGTNPKTGKPKAEISWESFRQEETIDGWPEDATFKSLSPELQKLAKENGITANELKKENTKESFRAIIRKKFPEKVSIGDAKWSGEGVSIPHALQQALPQVQLIPAVRDAAEEGQPGAKTSFGLLLERIILPAVIGSDEYKTLLTAVEELQKRLQGEGGAQIETLKNISKDISDRVSELIAAKVTLAMQPPDAKKFIGGSTLLQLDDGTLTRIALQGHGLQRALVFALLEVLASQNAKCAGKEAVNSRHTILLFEEPELFIHPHIMRRLKEALIKISQRCDWQVIVTTHSPFMIDVGTDPCSLVIHRRETPIKPPMILQLKVDPFAADGTTDERDRLRAVLDFHPTVSEVFFSKHAVLVEGDTEMAVLAGQPALYKLAGLTGDYHKDVTVVSCDGKWTIIPIARLLKAFNIPMRIIHDKDSKGKTEAELAAEPAHPFHANKRIAEVAGADVVMVVDDTFEHVLWEDAAKAPPKKDKPFRAWKRTQELCSEKTDLTHAPKLLKVVKFAFCK
jgi:predicted ATP-dependent endonuclease of OLD family